MCIRDRNKVAEIDHASYLVILPASAAAALDAYNAAENAMVVKKTKRGQKQLDLKTIIPHVEYEQAGEQLQFNLVLPCGSGEAPNYNPALLLGYLQQQYNIDVYKRQALITVRIRFEKTGEAAYISLLDLQRVFHRILKRSGLPVYYTQGFNPHIYLSFACPLSLGQESL